MALYYAYVFPYIGYGIELYGTCANTGLTKLQTKQIKLLKILNKKDLKYSTNVLHVELQFLKCLDIHTSFVLIFVYKQQHNLLQKIFRNYYFHNHVFNKKSTQQSNNLLIK